MSEERIIELEREVSDLRREIGWLRENCEELSKRLHRRTLFVSGPSMPMPMPLQHRWGERKPIVIMGIDPAAAGIDVL